VSILNQTSDGLFNVLIVLVRTIVRFGSRPREDLLKACGVGLDQINPDMLNNTLTRWTALGLFALDGDKVVLVEPYATDLGRSPDLAEARLPSAARRVALAAENNERFWEGEASKSADFSRGAAWVLAQDVYAVDTRSEGLQALETAQFPNKEKPIVQNNTRWPALRTWMAYLGLGRVGEPWTIDPTEALRQTLPTIFAGRRELAAAEFLESTAQALPVLDGGAYRLEVEGVLRQALWRPPREGLLSTSLSRALQRLDREGDIRIKQLSDTDGVSLSGANGRTWRDMTHVALTSGKGAR
jgi:hypothetical protein